jgi:hypothetical protein
MQIIDVENLKDSQLQMANTELDRKFWRSLFQVGVPLLFFVAIWTNVIQIPIAEAPALLQTIFHGLVKVAAVLSGFAFIAMPALCLKAQREVQQEILRRQGSAAG